ncbi:hypothetical protein DN752_17560 [Echinicola strongylocentroti]|uniref:Chromosome segregation protein SMC n=1 Tax=Echinicola strongylocentroti TaxID=1795355 RepID=A0A2Z4IM51_9BACT|nr:hypothetical protein [Echinicola strongylocentroti]AWW31790.1 hypothetical protein DN752_17560 [Echinicola strongylocentroti]
MSTNIPEEKSSRNEKGKNILIIVLLLLVIFSGIKLYFDSVDKSQKTEEILILSEENNDLNLRIDSMAYQLDLRINEIKKLGGNVDSLVVLKEQLLAERNTERNRSTAEINELNKKIDSFSGVLTEKDTEIEQLKKVNEQLFTENQDLKTSKAEIEDSIVQLNLKQEKLEEKVNIAQKLYAENIVVAAVNSRGREREGSFRNRHIDKLKVSLDITENNVAEPGTRDIFVQVIAPNNQVIFDIAKGSGTFTIDGREEFYTAKQAILYDNTRKSLIYLYQKESDYPEGTYQVKVYSEGFNIGNRTFEVK